MAEPRRHGKRQELVAATLRGEIVQGLYPAGSRLPSYAEIAERFGVSPVTIQRAVDRLATEGFVQTRERSGMHVVGTPPHLHHYALVFAEDPGRARTWSRYYAALVNAAVVIGRQEGRTILPFYGIDGHTDTADYRRLAALTAAHRVAGLIFVQGEHYVADTPLMTQPDMPRVTLKSRQRFPHVPIVTNDTPLFIAKALDLFTAHGRKRVALLSTPKGPEALASTEELFQQAMRGRPLTTQPYWSMPIHAEAGEGARRFVQLLMAGNEQTRPDALLVTDDNLIEETVGGLVAAGVRVPEDLEVVAHCNFPWLGSRALPLTLLGFDTRQALSACLAVIDRQRAGETVPAASTMEPLFESERTVTPTRTREEIVQ